MVFGKTYSLENSIGESIFREDLSYTIGPWRALLDEGAVVGGNVAVVRVLLEHVDLQLDLFLLVLRDIHHLDGGQLTRLGVTPLVHLSFVI